MPGDAVRLATDYVFSVPDPSARLVRTGRRAGMLAAWFRPAPGSRITWAFVLLMGAGHGWVALSTLVPAGGGWC